jgi:hypothetical protein
MQAQVDSASSARLLLECLWHLAAAAAAAILAVAHVVAV